MGFFWSLILASRHSNSREDPASGKWNSGSKVCAKNRSNRSVLTCLKSRREFSSSQRNRRRQRIDHNAINLNLGQCKRAFRPNQTHGTIKTHSGNWRQSYTLYREKSVHTLARKHANLNLSAWSLLLLQPMQNKMKNNVNPYRSLQVMHVRLRRFNSSLVK